MTGNREPIWFAGLRTGGFSSRKVVSLDKIASYMMDEQWLTFSVGLWADGYGSQSGDRSHNCIVNDGWARAHLI